jgi:LysM repeat protein
MTNRLDSSVMSSGDDDFWGGQSDWSDRANTQPTSRVPRTDASIEQSAVPLNVEAERAGQRFKRRVSNLFSSGANATREHGIVRPEAARPVEVARAAEPADGMFDDLDDFDYTYGDTAVAASTPRHDQAAAPESQDWDAEFAPEPLATGPTESPGVDPLLMRLGVVALVAALLVPALLSFRGSSTEALIESASLSGPTATFNLLPADAAAAEGSTADAGTADAATTEGSTSGATSQLDPNDLPPAIPVNAQQPTVTESAALGAKPLSATQLADSAMTRTNGSAALGAAAANAPADRVEPVCAIDYEVVAGDFWIRLADAAEVSLAELLEANGATSLTPIYPGTSICLPAGATTPVAPTATAAPDTTVPATTSSVTTSSVTTSPAVTTPTTATPAGTTPSSSNSTPDEVKQIIRDVWPDELEERAIEIAYRESRYVPTAKNYCCYGLFQIYWSVHQSWLDGIGITDDQQLYDPATNARAAYELYQRAGGWGPWGY